MYNEIEVEIKTNFKVLCNIYNIHPQQMFVCLIQINITETKKSCSLCTAGPKLYTILMKMRWKIMNFLHFCIIKYNICSLFLLFYKYFLPCFTYLTKLYVYTFTFSPICERVFTQIYTQL